MAQVNVADAIRARAEMVAAKARRHEAVQALLANPRVLEVQKSVEEVLAHPQVKRVRERMSDPMVLALVLGGLLAVLLFLRKCPLPPLSRRSSIPLERAPRCSLLACRSQLAALAGTHSHQSSRRLASRGASPPRPSSSSAPPTPARPPSSPRYVFPPFPPSSPVTL